MAASRGTEPERLAKLFRGELDWILLKALEKDRTRRYDTANGLAADIQRYLADEVVEARPPSAGYLFKKVKRRNKGPVSGALAVLIVFVLGMVGTAWGRVQAERARTAAADQEAARARAEAEIERQQQAEERRRVRNWDAATALLSQVESALRAGNAKLGAEAFEQAQKRIGEGGADDLKEALDRCRLDLTMLRQLDQIDDDRWSIVDGKRSSWEAMAPRWAAAFAGYGIAPGTTSVEEAARRINDALIRERLLTSLEVWFVVGRDPVLRRILALADPDEFRNEARGTNYSTAVLSLALQGKPVPPVQPVWFAIGHGEDRAVDPDTREQLLLIAHRARPNSYSLLMALGRRLGNREKESGTRRAGWCRAALALSPTSAAAWNNLGIALNGTGDRPGAVASFKEAIRLDPKFAMAHNNLGAALKASDDRPGAIIAYKEAIRLDPKLVQAHNNLGLVLNDSGDRPGAMASFKEAIRLDPKNAPAHYSLGRTAGLGRSAGRHRRVQGGHPTRSQTRDGTQQPGDRSE